MMIGDFAPAFSRALETGLSEWGIEVSKEHQEKLMQFAEMVLDGNQRLNLTRITEPQEMAVKPL